MVAVFITLMRSRVRIRITVNCLIRIHVNVKRVVWNPIRIEMLGSATLDLSLGAESVETRPSPYPLKKGTMFQFYVSVALMQ